MKTPVTHDQMLRMFESNQKANMEIIRSMQTAVNATTKSETDRIDTKLDGVIDRQDAQNDAVKKNGKRIAEVEITTGFVNRLRKNVKWIILGLFGFCYTTAWIYQNIDIVELIKTLILKKL